jgi:dipeptidyl aminopeptidase/acylaminoacyl peptidase
MLCLLVSSLVAATPASLPAPNPPSGPHAFTIRDLVALDRISDPAMSPDGKWVAFTRRSTDLAANKGRRDVWLAATDGSKVQVLAPHEADDNSARWMPDGKSLVFLSSRGGSQQVWRVNASGGEPTQVTTLPVDVDNLVVFPDGQRLLFTAEVYPDLPAASALEETVKRDASVEASPVKAKVYDQLLFRHWDTWEDGKRSHVFVWTLPASGAKASAPVDLMAGMDADAPPRPFGGAEELAVSPDGKEVAFGARRLVREAAWTTETNIFTVPAKGGVAPKLLTANPGHDGQPTYSPDGKYLAYLAMRRPGYEADRATITLVERKSGQRREVAPAWDRSVHELVWRKNSKGFWVTADNVGQQSLFEIGLDGKVNVLVEKGTSVGPSEGAGKLVIAHDTLGSPADLHTLSLDGKGLTAITQVNTERLKDVRLAPFEQFKFTGANNETVYGHLVKPVDFDPAKKYPIAFLIHGGPQVSMGNHWHYRWNGQAFAGVGYATVLIDFHGSPGYGQAFTDAINQDWGGKPYEDLLKGLDHVLQKYPFLDGDRVAALGASYGGFMVNWIGTQTTRFKALVSHSGIYDNEAAYADTEELWFAEWESGGTPWKNPEGYRKFNPSRHIQSWKTPTLVIHGARDYRIPDTQGMSLFTALQRLGVKSRFISFPDENHWVQKPRNSIFWYDQVTAFLAENLRSGSPAPATTGGASK